jgi:thiol-disulfide isomerase/thioredoxin
MFKTFFLSGIIILSSLFLFGQTKGYEIKVKITPLKNQPVYLGYHYGDNQYVIDTLMLNVKGEGIFKKNKSLPQGMYLIVLSNMKYFNFILSKNQQLSIQTDTTDLVQHLTIENDAENKLFADYQRFLSNTNETIAAFKQKIKLHPDSEIIYRKEINRQKAALRQQQNNLIGQNPEFLFIKIIKAIQQTDFTFDAEKFFANVDFTDERLLFTPVFSNKLDEFFTSIPTLTTENVDSLDKALDYILMQSMKNPSVYEEISKYLIGQFDLSGNYPNTDAFWHLADKYFLNDLTPWVNEAFKAKLSKYNQRIHNVIMNQPFPALSLCNETDKSVKVPESDAKYTLIVFWNPECEHCVQYLAELKSIYQTYNRQQFEVIAILTSDKPELWKKTIHENDFIWKNYYDKKLLNDFIEDLFLYSTPQLFLLDKDKKIVAKDISTDELDTWLKKH